MGIVVDTENGQVIWAEHKDGLIRRKSLDGSGPIATILSGLDKPAALAFDPVHRKLYWSEKGTGTIRRANIDGSDPETLVTGVFQVLGLVLDLRHGQMYWTNSSIMQSTLDGASITERIDFPLGFDAVAITFDPELVLDLPTIASWGVVLLTLALVAAGIRRVT